MLQLTHRAPSFQTAVLLSVSFSCGTKVPTTVGRKTTVSIRGDLVLQHKAMQRPTPCSIFMLISQMHVCICGGRGSMPMCTEICLHVKVGQIKSVIFLMLF